MNNLKTNTLIGYYDSSDLYKDEDGNSREPDDWEFEQMATDCEEALTDWVEHMIEKVDYMEKPEVEDENLYLYGWINDFGWRNQSGHLLMKVKTGAEILNKTLPKTQCTYYIYNEETENKDYVLRILNFHHDSPTGETYYFRLATKEERESL